MLLVRAIGQRYLWVDSLCIVQDSTSSWELNAKAMHLNMATPTSPCVLLMEMLRRDFVLSDPFFPWLETI